MTSDIHNRVYGCLIGGAIGDALGAGVENWSYQQVREKYGRVENFQPYDNPMSSGAPGSVTDDTVMRQYLSLSIVKNNGRITPDEYADVLIEHLNTDRVWITEEITYLKLLAGLNPWDTGRSTIKTGTATMHIGPIGIINAGDPRQAYQDGFNIASITQDGVERDAAATVAAGVAEAFSESATVEDILETMIEHTSETLYRAIDLTLGLAEDSESVDEFVELFYDEMLDWSWPAVEWDREKYYDGEIFSASSLEILPASIGILFLCNDVNRAIVEAASFGRDCDTIGSVVGSLGGALHGADVLRNDWIQECEQVNRELFEEIHGDPDEDFEAMADQLVSALEAQRDRVHERGEILENLL